MRLTYVANEKLNRSKHPTKLRQRSHFPSNEHVAQKLIFMLRKKVSDEIEKDLYFDN